MFSSKLSSGSSKTGDRFPRAETPGSCRSSKEQLPELSDVPCYTCRRRHVKCDKILPHCAKCAKKGVPCSGYRKPLRWADGVAVRGKFKGKTEPVIADEAISAAQSAIKVASVSIQAEARHFGLNTTGSHRVDVTSTNSTFLELIRYYNTSICAERPMARSSPAEAQRIGSISSLAARDLPRDILNCLLGVSAVHMAVRNPGNREVERIALETKVTLFRGINTLFEKPNNERPDVTFTCISLMFAMDAIENGVNRWRTHFCGAVKFLGAYNGLDAFVSNYPHLKSMVASILNFDTLYPALGALSTNPPIFSSRSWIRTICFDAEVQKFSFNTCPLPLMRAMFNLTLCAKNIFRNQNIASAADMYTREWILQDVLVFQPEEGIRSLEATYYADSGLSAAETLKWNLVYRAWRAAITIVVIRELFFGLSEADFPYQLSRSTTPIPPNQHGTEENLLDPSQTFDLLPDNSFPSDIESYLVPEQLSPELQTKDLSYQNSPAPSPPYYTNNITFDYWHNRYPIHNEAFSDLHHTLGQILRPENESFLRYALLPLIILALTSRPNSAERSLGLSGFQRFGHTVAAESLDPGPIGGFPLPFDIPWDQLDAYSTEEEGRTQNLSPNFEPQLRDSAPEWNWNSMLKQIDLKLMWPVWSGSVHREHGTEFWAFNVLSACCNEESFAAFMQPQSVFPHASAST